jgi:hypothetical protein
MLLEFADKKKFDKRYYAHMVDNTCINRSYSSIKNHIRDWRYDRTIMRHDVDHDIHEALRIARWEAEKGLTSTYCMLHTAWYYGTFIGKGYEHSDILKSAVVELVSMGHEVNFHNNLISLALKNNISVKDILLFELEKLRSYGAEVIGTSTHGDSLCHKYNFRNFEIFSEISDKYFIPSKSIPSNSEMRSKLSEHIGQISMKECGLEYEAYGFRPKVYTTDSGGKLQCLLVEPGWSQVSTNVVENYDVSLHSYILTHPVWWNFGE